MTGATKHAVCTVARRLLSVSFFTPFKIRGRWYYVAPAIPDEDQRETVFGPFNRQDKAEWDATSAEAMW